MAFNILLDRLQGDKYLVVYDYNTKQFIASFECGAVVGLAINEADNMPTVSYRLKYGAINSVFTYDIHKGSVLIGADGCIQLAHLIDSIAAYHGFEL